LPAGSQDIWPAPPAVKNKAKSHDRECQPSHGIGKWPTAQELPDGDVNLLGQQGQHATAILDCDDRKPGSGRQFFNSIPREAMEIVGLFMMGKNEWNRPESIPARFQDSSDFRRQFPWFAGMFEDFGAEHGIECGIAEWNRQTIENPVKPRLIVGRQSDIDSNVLIAIQYRRIGLIPAPDIQQTAFQHRRRISKRG
jgi:hypothetical protein